MAAAYTNCTRPMDFTTGPSKMSGGDGYSGKLYVTVNSGGLCPDGSPYLQQIQFANNQAYLTRDSCADVSAQPIDVVVSSVDSNVLAFGMTVLRESKTLTLVPRAPTVLAALGMTASTSTNHVCSGADCWKFETNGSISRQVDFSTSGNFDFTVLARADLSQGLGANMDLKIDGVTAGSALVSSLTDSEYSIQANVTSGRHEISISFTNDFQDGSGDRNLYAASVRIDEVGVVTSACLNRTSGSLLTLATSQVPYLDKALAADTRVDARAVNYNGTASGPIKLGGGSDVCISGGTITGAWPLTATHSTVSSTFAVGLYGPNFLIENYRADNYGNCIGIWDNATGFTVRGAYCTQIRGDFVSNKESWGGAIEDSLFDGGITFFNDRNMSAALSGATATIRNNLVRLQSFDQTYWGTPGHGWFWKQDPSTTAVKLHLHGNVFMAEQPPLTNNEWLDPSTVASCKKADGSPDNTIVWLGTGAYPRPEELATGCFTLSTDRTVWDQAAAAWKTRHGY